MPDPAMEMDHYFQNMSDLAKEIHDDEQLYRRLCERYVQQPRFKPDGRLDTYGPHADDVRGMWRLDQDSYPKTWGTDAAFDNL